MTASPQLLQSVLQSRFGIEEFRPKQEEVISSILNKQHTLALLPTGYGKSLCYQVPSQVLPGVTLVVSPLIALMQDQVSGLIRKGIVNATVLSSHVSPDEQSLRLAGIKAGAYKLVYVAPERFDSQRFRSVLESVDISLLVIDEAHCISQWGHDFRPHYRGLSAHLRRLPEAVILAVTATATPQVEQDIVNTLAPGAMHVVHACFDRPNLHFEVKAATDTADKDRYLNRAIRSQSGPIIIYTSSRKETERLAKQLKSDGVKAGHYHAGMSQDQRTRTQKSFEQDKLAVIVSTVAFGMGVDKPNIRHVIHYNIPGSLEAYYQEAGRAGRDGHPATCTLLYQAKDVNTQRWLMDRNFPSDAEVQSVYKTILNAGEDGLRTTELASRLDLGDSALNSALDLLKHLNLVELRSAGTFNAAPREVALVAKIDMTYMQQRRLREQARLDRIIRYGQEKICRRKQILNYFGQELESGCAGCDVCSPKPIYQGRSGSFCDSSLSKFSSANYRLVNGNGYEYEENRQMSLDDLTVSSTTDGADLYILALIAELPGFMGRIMAASTLVGSNSKKIKERGLNLTKTWGALKSSSEDAVLARIDELLESGLLSKSGGLYPTVSLTRAGERQLERLTLTT